MKQWTGPELKALRLKAGLTQCETADRVGVSQPYAWKMENRSYWPKTKKARARVRKWVLVCSEVIENGSSPPHVLPGAWTGPQLQGLRKKSGLSVRQLAERMEVSAARVYRMEVRNYRPTHTTACRSVARYIRACGEPIRHRPQPNNPSADDAEPATEPINTADVINGLHAKVKAAEEENASLRTQLGHERANVDTLTRQVADLSRALDEQDNHGLARDEASWLADATRHQLIVRTIQACASDASAQWVEESMRLAQPTPTALAAK